MTQATLEAQAAQTAPEVKQPVKHRRALLQGNEAVVEGALAA